MSSIPGPRSDTLMLTIFPAGSAVMVMGVSARRILGCILQQLHQHLRNALQIDPHRRQRVGICSLTSRPARTCFDSFERRVHHFADVMRLAAQFHLLRIELCHLRRLAHQTVQAIGFLVDHGEQLLPGFSD